MGLTSSMYTSLSGLNASQKRLDVTGNNIANVNTLAYKGSRALFQTQLSQTMSFGTPPTGTSGGTNPMQIGLGVGMGTVQKDMSDGSIETTGVRSDVAIQGNGFFVLQNHNGNTVFSRDGAFTVDANQNLVNANGSYVMGYTVDDRFNIITGAPSKLTIPLGQLSVAQATQNAMFTGNLSSGGDIAVTPGSALSETLVDITSGNRATGATALTSLATEAKPGINLFAVGNVITLEGQKGGVDIVPPPSFTVTAGATGNVNSGGTVAEFMEWVQAQMALDPNAPQGTPAGVSIVDGQITVTGNLGPQNVPGLAFTSNGDVPTPFIFTSNTPKDVGSGAYTNFLAYDSLGNPVNITMSFALVEKSSTGNTWQFYAESTDDTDPSKFLGTGTVTFNTAGNLIDATGTTITLNRADTGALDPVTVNLDFSNVMGLTSGQSTINLDRQDGRPAGTLNDFSVAADGTLVGSFSNGLAKPLGQIVLANFSNPEGLIAQENNAFIAGPNSGEPNIGAPGTRGTGGLIGGALELSNIDITREFINMVTASTAFSAAGKVISTSQQLLNELMTIVR